MHVSWRIVAAVCLWIVLNYVAMWLAISETEPERIEILREDGSAIYLDATERPGRYRFAADQSRSK